LDEKQYRRDRLAIAGFLIDAANDDMTLPMLPGTKKLGTEQVQVHFKGDVQNAVTAAYYLNKAYEKNLDIIALKYDIELKDVKMLAALKEIGETNSFTEIADLSGMTEVSVAGGLMKMVVKGFVSVKYTAKQMIITFGRNADAISQDLGVALQDLQDVMTKNLTEEEQETLNAVLNKATDNLRKYVKKNEE